MKRRRLLFLLLPLGLAIGVVFAHYRGKRSEFAILSQTSHLVYGMTASEIGRKPFLSFSLPVIGHVRVPDVPRTPKDFGMNPQVGGLIAPRESALHFERTWLHSMDTIDFGAGQVRDLPMLDTSDIDSKTSGNGCAAMPYVFGDRPREVWIQARHYDQEPIKVRLPPNNIAEPETSSTALVLGSWTLGVTVEPWFSPSLARRVRLTVENGPPGDLLFTVKQDNQPARGYLLASGDRTAVFEMDQWQEKPKLYFDLRSAIAEALTLKVWNEPKGFSLRDKAGVTYLKVRGDQGDIDRWEASPPKKHLAVEVEDWWITNPPYLKPGYGDTRPNIANWKQGMTFRATGYGPTGGGSGSIGLSWPASQSYRNWPESP